MRKRGKFHTILVFLFSDQFHLPAKIVGFVQGGSMQDIEVTLETVTPLFLGGAETRGIPEVRAPSFRGGMRYWLRALLGIQHASNLAKIHEIEESVFGSTDRSSSVSIRANEISDTEPFSKNFSPDNDPGKNYLLWATQTAGRQAFPAATTKIELKMNCRKQEDLASAAIWLLVHLGGLGTRSRRGLGSLFVADVEKWNPEFPSLVFSGENYQEFLADGMEKWQQILNLRPANLHGLPKFDILHPSYSGIFIYQSDQGNWTDWKDALEWLGNNILRDFRDTAKFKSDHDGVLNVIKGTGKPPTVERAIFGLPMQFYYSGYHQEFKRNHRNINDKESRKYATAQILPSFPGKKFERRASPIHFKFAKLTDKSLILIATFFKSEFLPSDFNLRISPGGRDRSLKKETKFVSLPKYTLLENFFSNETWLLVYGGKFGRQP